MTIRSALHERCELAREPAAWGPDTQRLGTATSLAGLVATRPHRGQCLLWSGSLDELQTLLPLSDGSFEGMELVHRLCSEDTTLICLN